jgi:hypothetical protein
MTILLAALAASLLIPAVVIAPPVAHALGRKRREARRPTT